MSRHSAGCACDFLNSPTLKAAFPTDVADHVDHGAEREPRPHVLLRATDRGLPERVLAHDADRLVGGPGGGERPCVALRIRELPGEWHLDTADVGETGGHEQ